MSQSKTFGDLVLQFTNRYDHRWSGRNSHASFWQPIPPTGFKPLGSVALITSGGELSVNIGLAGGLGLDVAALCVAETEPGSGALRAPVNYDLIWEDHHSGSSFDGSCWRPVPPSGYVALGDVFTTGYKNPPSLLDVVCVREDLVGKGAIGSSTIWDSSGTRAKAFSAWQVEPPERYVDTTRGLIAVNSFVGVDSLSKPSSSQVARCLCLPLPVVPMEPPPPPPALEERSIPKGETRAEVDNAVWVPLTAVRDPEKTAFWQVENSPFYQLQRLVWYTLLIYDDNGTSIQQDHEHRVTVGITTSQSESFSKKTGVSVTAGGGVSFLGSGGKMSATVTEEMGWETSTGIAQFVEKSVTAGLSVPPRTAAALWAASYAFRVLRMDGEKLDDWLPFVVQSYHQSQFPPADVDDQPEALFFELPPIAERIPA